MDLNSVSRTVLGYYKEKSVFPVTWRAAEIFVWIEWGSVIMVPLLI